MEVKGLLEKIRQKEDRKESFFAIELDQGIVKSAIWQVEDGMAKIQAIGEGRTWEQEEELVEVIDASLPEAETEPKKVIFGLPPDWVEGSKITPAKLTILKKISQELELSPVGFVIIAEAIVHYLKTTEGIPPTAIIVGLGKKRLTLTLAKLGKIVGIQLVDRSGQLGADLAEGLSRFDTQEVFPARILLTNFNEDLEEERQQLITYSWPESRVSFLHLPKVEILPQDFDIKAVCLAGGREVAEAKGIQVELEPKPESKPEPGIETEPEPGPEPEQKPEQEQETEMMGFLRDKDITLEKSLDQPVVPAKEETLISPEEAPPIQKKMNFKDLLSRIPRPDFAGKTYLIAGIALLVVVILGSVVFAGYWYLPKATIVLVVKQQVLAKDFTIKLDPSLSAPDQENLALPGAVIKADLEDEGTQATTGKKAIGDPAKGEVTVYNRTDKQKTFVRGSEISGPNNLKFSFDDEVIVASESAGPDYVSLPGKAKVRVTAKAIGSDGNLASGTEFSLGNLSRSDFIAKNETAFIGGTSRDVQVVDAKDQEVLLGKLTEELKAKALDELGKVAPPGKKIVPDSLTTAVTEKTFSQDVGQEATELRLKLKAGATVLSYSEAELTSLLQDKVKDTVPPGFEYQPGDEVTNFSLQKVTKEGVAIFDIHFQANLMPQLDLEKMKQDLAGKFPDLARQYLGNLPNIDASEISLTPRLPAQIATLPRISKNIKIEIRTQ